LVIANLFGIAASATLSGYAKLFVSFGHATKTVQLAMTNVQLILPLYLSIMDSHLSLVKLNKIDWRKYFYR